MRGEMVTYDCTLRRGVEMCNVQLLEHYCVGTLEGYVCGNYGSHIRGCELHEWMWDIGHHKVDVDQRMPHSRLMP